MRSDGIPRTAYDYLASHESRLDRLELRNVTVSTAAIQTAVGTGNRTYAQADEPFNPNIGDLWVDTDNGNILYRWDGLEWTVIGQNDDLNPAISATDAAFAQMLISVHTKDAISDGIVYHYIQSFAQTDATPGDVWYDPDNEALYRMEAPYGTDVLTNRHLDPSLETGSVGVGTADNTSIYRVTQDTTVKYSGTGSRKSVRIKDITQAPARIARMILSPDAPNSAYKIFVTPGETISAMYRIKVDTAANCTLNMRFFNGAGVLIGASVPSAQDPATLVPVKTRWTRIRSENVVVPANAAYVSLVMTADTPDGGNTAGGETVWVDAVSLNGGIEVQPYIDPYQSPLIAWSGTANASQSVYRPGWINTFDGTLAPAQDPPTAQELVDAKTLLAFYQLYRPDSTNRTVGDMWIDTADGNRLYLWVGNAWVAVYGPGIDQVIDGLHEKTTTFYQPDPPQSAFLTVGDLWFDTDNGNMPHRWNGSEWIEFTWGQETFSTLTPPPAPVTAPTPTIIGGIGALFITWPDTGAVEATVNVYVSANSTVDPIASNLVGTVQNSSKGLLSIRALADGTPLQPGVVYTAVLTVSNPSGTSNVSLPGSGQLGQVTGPDLSVNALTTDHLLANDALISALQVEGIDANIVRTGVLNAERVSIGSTTTGSMVINGNMEDPVTSPTGTVLPNSFAGWTLSTVEGTPGGTVTEGISSPISGTRSMLLSVSTVPGLRAIQNRSYPVTSGYKWRVTAQVRTNRTIDQSATGTPLVELTMHTSTGVLDPDSSQGSFVVWQRADVLQSFVSDTLYQLDGFVTVPPGHRRAKISVKAFAALDGSPWSILVDEVTAVPVESEFQVVDPVTDSIVASINRTGDITGHDIDYSGTLNITDALFRGELLDDALGRSGNGLLAWGNLTPAVTNINAETGVMALDLYMDESRSCSVNLIGNVESNTADARFNVRVRYNYSATGQPSPATTASTLLRTIPLSTNAGTFTNQSFTAGLLAHLDPGYYSFFVSVSALSGTPTFNTVGTWEMFLVDLGPNIGTLNQAYVPGGTAPPGRTFTKLYDATDGASWAGNNTQIGSTNDNLFFGNSPTAPNGNRKAAIWFNDAKIRSDLAGATVLKVELYLYLSAGGVDNIAVIGSHGDSTVRTNYSNIVGKSLDEYHSSLWSSDTGRWVDLGAQSGWKTGSKRGIILGPGPTDSDKFAMQAAAVNTSKRPVLRITYQR